MPTYEYRCADCGQHVEVVQSFTDDPLTECGACGGKLKKVFGSVGIVFKGSGFYKTDSRPSRSGDGDGAKSDSKSDSQGSNSRGSDSKSSDSGSSGSKGSDSKGSDSKSSDSKGSDSKSSSSSSAPAKSA